MSLLSFSLLPAKIITENDGYYSFTDSGKILLRVIAVLLVIGAILLHAYLSKKSGKEKKSELTTKQLVICGMCMALAVVCSNVKFLSLYNGGSITLFSMFFITYIAYCFGLSTGLTCGLAYGILQFPQDPYLLSAAQVIIDYVFAFMALGLGGLFRNLKKKDQKTGEKKLGKSSLIVCYGFGAFARGAFASLAGYIFWMDYMPESFPKAISFLYPVAYNFCYIGVEAALTIVVLMIPGVSSILLKLRREVND